MTAHEILHPCMQNTATSPATNFREGCVPVCVGSSFGGWQALHIAVERPEQVAGLVLIAPALDFTSRLWKSYTPEQQQHYQQQGEAPVGSRYLDGGQVMVNIEFFRKAESFLVLDRLHELNVQCPLRILHGVKVRLAVQVQLSRPQVCKQQSKLPIGMSCCLDLALRCSKMACKLTLCMAVSPPHHNTEAPYRGARRFRLDSRYSCLLLCACRTTWSLSVLHSSCLSSYPPTMWC